jgi:hypothetical protein
MEDRKEPEPEIMVSLEEMTHKKSDVDTQKHFKFYKTEQERNVPIGKLNAIEEQFIE